MMSEQRQVEIKEEIETALYRWCEWHEVSLAAEDVLDRLYEYLKEDL